MAVSWFLGTVFGQLCTTACQLSLNSLCVRQRVPCMLGGPADRACVGRGRGRVCGHHGGPLLLGGCTDCRGRQWTWCVLVPESNDAASCKQLSCEGPCPALAALCLTFARPALSSALVRGGRHNLRGIVDACETACACCNHIAQKDRRPSPCSALIM